MTQTEPEAHTDNTPQQLSPCRCQSYLRATEHAALRAARWLGRADQEAAEAAAAEGMQYSLDILPIRGRIDSLNVSAAAAALVYGVLQFRAHGG